MAHVPLNKRYMVFIFMSAFIFVIINFSFQNGIRFFDQKATGFHIYVCIHVFKYISLTFHSIITKVPLTKRQMLDSFMFVCLYFKYVLTFLSVMA